ncbi:recombinase for Bh,Int [Bacillus methanolicus MGA3]|uniref:Recombinase for Bh,Int n=1 Tax=Bacillus methanolicus (strain MGA3 / ATCC 53907) TaxID=796606 RepID=A0A068LPN6_BACMM|nr:recombinase for Bh,Int [Bacillus methanolicus MGA3]
MAQIEGFVHVERISMLMELILSRENDKVNHDKLMGILAKTIEDRILLKLICRYLQSGVMINGVVMETDMGTPQGGPLSPLLSNIMLHELDKELEKRGHKFVRYADDCNIYVKTKKAGIRVMNSITNFIEKELKLKVNKEKSAVDRPWKRKFLGFSFTPNKTPKIRMAKESVKRFKNKIREITSRSKPYRMEERIEKLNMYLMGWCGYFALADTPSKFKELDEWIRRRLRMCLWKEWKTPKTRIRKLRALGVPSHKAIEWGNTHKKYWRIACSPILHKTLDNSYWSHQGLRSLFERYHFLRHT